MSTQVVIDGYTAAATELIDRFEAVSSATLYDGMSSLLPAIGSNVLDLGAGTGRDAAWFAARGCHVLAVEPVARFRTAGAERHSSPRIEWLDDCLPELSAVRARGGVFDFVLLSAVWQHLDAHERQRAMPALRAVTAPAGRLLLSVRHGPGASNRPCFLASVDETTNVARASGFREVFRHSAASLQEGNRRAGVTWTWLGFVRS